MHIGKVIKRIKLLRGMNTASLARACNIPPRYLVKIERGEVKGYATVNVLAAALQVSPAIIFALSLERNDLPENRRGVYDELFLTIEELAIKTIK